MCGEKSAPRITSPVSWGSPPHVRGKGFCAVEIHCCCGITPACAGKSGTVGAVGNAIGDHPRMCGEKAAFQRLHLAMLGSPPHVRGKDLQRPRQHRGTGITPACAGKSFCFRSSSVRTWDHPRMCGEKGSRYREQIYSLGSPPQVRGKVTFVIECPQLPKDHPRMCGEKMHMLLCVPASYGSPPHMRGKGRVRHVFLPFSGITPAHAGKSSILVAHWSAVWDHPRTCGEKSGSMSNFSRCSGSPPHMRGKVPYHDNAWFLTRITPAHAGKSFPVRRSVLW